MPTTDVRGFLTMHKPHLTPQAKADFPFYAGDPVLIGPWQWTLVLASVVLALVLLLAPQLRLGDRWGLFLPSILFCTVPLVGLAAAAGRRWTAIFRPIDLRQLAWMAGIAVLNLLATILVGLALSQVSHMSANPAFHEMSTMSSSDRLIRLAAMAPQLLGEELLTILPLLACLWLLHTRLGISRRLSIVAAWGISAIPFALIHLPTYDWNLLQCLAVIGSARLILSLAYLATRNLWISTGAHVLNDWTLFGLGMLSMPSAP